MTATSCRICSCVDHDCTWCVVLTGAPCNWVETDLCSACAAFGSTDAERARNRANLAFHKAGKRWSRVPGGPALDLHGRQCLRVAAVIEAQQRSAVA